MTKEEIITQLQSKAKEDEAYYMDADLIDAINKYPEPFELVEPIQKLLEPIQQLILVCQGILFIL